MIATHSTLQRRIISLLTFLLLHSFNILIPTTLAISPPNIGTQSSCSISSGTITGVISLITPTPFSTSNASLTLSLTLYPPNITLTFFDNITINSTTYSLNGLSGTETLTISSVTKPSSNSVHLNSITTSNLTPSQPITLILTASNYSQDSKSTGSFTVNLIDSDGTTVIGSCSINGTDYTQSLSTCNDITPSISSTKSASKFESLNLNLSFLLTPTFELTDYLHFEFSKESLSNPAIDFTTTSIQANPLKNTIDSYSFNSINDLNITQIQAGTTEIITQSLALPSDVLVSDFIRLNVADPLTIQIQGVYLPSSIGAVLAFKVFVRSPLGYGRCYFNVQETVKTPSEFQNFSLGIESQQKLVSQPVTGLTIAFSPSRYILEKGASIEIEFSSNFSIPTGSISIPSNTGCPPILATQIATSGNLITITDFLTAPLIQGESVSITIEGAIYPNQDNIAQQTSITVRNRDNSGHIQHETTTQMSIRDTGFSSSLSLSPSNIVCEVSDYSLILITPKDLPKSGFLVFELSSLLFDQISDTTSPISTMISINSVASAASLEIANNTFTFTYSLSTEILSNDQIRITLPGVKNPILPISQNIEIKFKQIEQITQLTYATQTLTALLALSPATISMSAWSSSSLLTGSTTDISIGSTTSISLPSSISPSQSSLKITLPNELGINESSLPTVLFSSQFLTPENALLTFQFNPTNNHELTISNIILLPAITYTITLSGINTPRSAKNIPSPEILHIYSSSTIQSVAGGALSITGLSELNISSITGIYKTTSIVNAKNSDLSLTLSLPASLYLQHEDTICIFLDQTINITSLTQIEFTTTTSSFSVSSADFTLTPNATPSFETQIVLSIPLNIIPSLNGEITIQIESTQNPRSILAPTFRVSASDKYSNKIFASPPLSFPLLDSLPLLKSQLFYSHQQSDPQIYTGEPFEATISFNTATEIPPTGLLNITGFSRLISFQSTINLTLASFPHITPITPRLVIDATTVILSTNSESILIPFSFTSGSSATPTTSMEFLLSNLTSLSSHVNETDGWTIQILDTANIPLTLKTELTTSVSGLICRQSNCKSCFGAPPAPTCIECITGYTVDNTSFECVPASQFECEADSAQAKSGCQICGQNSVCVTCSTGYSLNQGSNTCESNPSNRQFQLSFISISMLAGLAVVIFACILSARVQFTFALLSIWSSLEIAAFVFLVITLTSEIPIKLGIAILVYAVSQILFFIIRMNQQNQIASDVIFKNIPIWLRISAKFLSIFDLRQFFLVKAIGVIMKSSSSLNASCSESVSKDRKLSGGQNDNNYNHSQRFLPVSSVSIHENGKSTSNEKTETSLFASQNFSSRKSSRKTSLVDLTNQSTDQAISTLDEQKTYTLHANVPSSPALNALLRIGMAASIVSGLTRLAFLILFDLDEGDESWFYQSIEVAILSGLNVILESAIFFTIKNPSTKVVPLAIKEEVKELDREANKAIEMPLEEMKQEQNAMTGKLGQQGAKKNMHQEFLQQMHTEQFTSRNSGHARHPTFRKPSIDEECEKQQDELIFEPHTFTIPSNKQIPSQRPMRRKRTKLMLIQSGAPSSETKILEES